MISNMKCIGAIIGDIVGSHFLESEKAQTLDFEFWGDEAAYSDDSVLTIATMDYFNHDQDKDISYYYKKWTLEYPGSGFGMMFYRWASSKDLPAYNSFGNGSAMRVSPVAYVTNDINEVKRLAKLTAECTHNHKEGIKGAEAIAVATFLARTTHDKEKIREYALSMYPRIKDLKLKTLHDKYQFDVTCQGSVPEAIFAFLESTSYEDCIRKVMYIGGDMDTIGAMAGAIADAFYGVKDEFVNKLSEYLPPVMIKVIEEFNKKFIKD